MDARYSPIKPCLDDADTDTRNAVWALLSTKVDKIFDDFFELVMESPHRHLFENRDFNDIKTKQIEHWETLFTCGDDQDCAEKLNKTYINHKDINVSSVDYVMAYIHFMTEFHRAVIQNADGPKQAYEFVRTVNAVVASDIERALRMYNDVLSI